MRSKLQKFATFANNLLPHEADYLLSVQKFDDLEKRSILQLISSNCRHISNFEAYDEAIDKRKYSSLKSWIEERLYVIDVDKEFEWLNATEVAIHTDAISVVDEKKLLRLYSQSDATVYNFLKLYELGRAYRHYLHVRMRYEAHQNVVEFLENHRTSYEYARMVNDKIHQATDDIVAQYAQKNADSMQWEHWLSSVFFERSLDGYNRILALIRLIFIAYNYRRFDLLPDKFDYLEELMRQGRFYSKRLLLNFYSQRLLMYTRTGNLEQAAYYGFLSVRAHNNDYLYYINNLAAVLLRSGKQEQAYDVLCKAMPTAKMAQNAHNKIGHAAYTILALNALGRSKQAAIHARTFFDAYKSDIFKHRWHLFFSAWLEALLALGQYDQMLKLAQIHHLAAKDESYQKSPNYTPGIPWLLALANFHLGKMQTRDLVDLFSRDLLDIYHGNAAAFPSWIGAILQPVSSSTPEILNELKGVMQKKGILLRVG